MNEQKKIKFMRKSVQGKICQSKSCDAKIMFLLKCLFPILVKKAFNLVLNFEKEQEGFYALCL